MASARDPLDIAAEQAAHALTGPLARSIAAMLRAMAADPHYASHPPRDRTGTERKRRQRVRDAARSQGDQAAAVLSQGG